MKIKMISKLQKLICSLIALSFMSCGDIFQPKTKITSHYFLMKPEGINGNAIYYRVGGGNFVGRVPSKVLEVGFDDNFVVAKCEMNNAIFYYIIDRKKDFEYAEDSVFLAAKAITESSFNEKWSHKINITLKKVP